MPTAVIRDCRGGWNPTDPAIAVGETQVTEAVNVTWEGCPVARKRRGCTLGTNNYLPATTIAHLFRHTPTGDTQSAWLFAVSDTGYVYEKQPGLTWSIRIFDDTIVTTTEVGGASFNGKFFFAVDCGSTIDCLHVYDPDVGMVRRVGLPAPSLAPTAANYSTGSYPATPHYYRMAWAAYVGATLMRRSELSPAVSFTPSGSGWGVNVTSPTAPGEGETHWELYASTDGAYYYRIQTLAVGALGTHAIVPTDFSDYPLADESGTYTRPWAAKYLIVDDNRLVFGGDFTDGARASLIGWTPVQGAEGVGDDERYQNTTDVKAYLNLDAYEGGGLRGFGGPINGVVFAFKANAIYKLVRTGQDTAPYVPVTITTATGALNQRSIVTGADAAGAPALYWLGLDGPYRYGANGLEYLGRVLETWWATLNLANVRTASHGIYDPHRKRIYWWVPEDGTACTTVLVYDVTRGAWSQWTGRLGEGAASVMACEDIGLGQVSVQAYPLVSLRLTGTDTRAIVWADRGTDDNGTTYQAYLTTRAFQPAPGQNIGITEVQVVAGAGGDVSVTLNADSGLDTRTVQVNLDAASSETLVARKVEGLENTSAQWVQVTVGDEAATATAWTVHQVTLGYRPEEAR